MQQTRGQELRLLSARVDAGAPAQEGEQPALAPSARPSRPKYYDDRHAASVADVGGIWLRAVDLHQTSLSRFAPRPSEPARSSVWCGVPSEGVVPALDDHAHAPK